jgi:hypothetical protein
VGAQAAEQLADQALHCGPVQWQALAYDIVVDLRDVPLPCARITRSGFRCQAQGPSMHVCGFRKPYKKAPFKFCIHCALSIWSARGRNARSDLVPSCATPAKRVSCSAKVGASAPGTEKPGFGRPGAMKNVPSVGSSTPCIQKVSVVIRHQFYCWPPSRMIWRLCEGCSGAIAGKAFEARLLLLRAVGQSQAAITMTGTIITI